MPLPHAALGFVLGLAIPTDDGNLRPSLGRELLRIPEPTIGGSSGRCETTLRGDWEEPPAILLVYTETWPDELRWLVAATAPTPIYLATEHDSRSTQRRWLKSLAQTDRDRIHVLSLQVDTPWVRDWGPLQARSFAGNAGLWLDFDYSEITRWRDDAAGSVLAAATGHTMDSIGVSLDGGGVVSDGRGSCVVTAEYVAAMGVDRFDREEMDILLGTAGCCRWAIVPALRREPTKHVDMTVHFAAHDTVLVAEIEPSVDLDDSVRLEATAEVISALVTADGGRFKIVRVPMPVLESGEYATYVNALRIPGALIVPSYGEVPGAQEQRAYDVIAGAMVRGRLVPTPADTMLALGGALHCAALGMWW